MTRLIWMLLATVPLLTLGCKSMQKGMSEIPADAPTVIVDKNADIHSSTAPFEVSYADVINDHIALNVSYSGGCEEHTFEILSDGKFTATYPPEVIVHIKHHDNGDRCRGMIDEKRYFNARTLQYPGTNRVRIVFAHNNRILDYIY